MTTQQLLLQLLLGGLLGITGQGIRMIIGLKKQSEEATANATTLRETFDASRLSISLFIGFIAGILAMLGYAGFDKELSGSVDTHKEILLGIIAAGYAGTDFIEGFISKYLPKTNSIQQQQRNPPTPPNPPANQPAT
jgi:hypothetical protein